MIQGLEDMSTALTAELSTPLRMGIGIHTGPAVVGRMGYGSVFHVTAVGDTINVASQLYFLLSKNIFKLRDGRSSVRKSPHGKNI